MTTPSNSPLVTHVIDELKVGGAQTHLVTMLREAVTGYRLRHRAIVLFGDGPIRHELEALGVAVDVLDMRESLQARRYDQIVRQLARLFRRDTPQLVEAHLTWSRLLGLFAAWRAGVPQRIAFEQGDIYFDKPPFRLANFAGQLLADHVVVCSEALGDWVHATHRVQRSRLEVFHNCVDLERFRPGKHAPADLPALSGATRFAAVGTLGSGVNKRVDVLVRGVAAATRRGADVQLFVCGDGPQRVELEGLAVQLGVADRVVFLGVRRDVPAVLEACDAFIHAAPFEPFGIVAIEAMACHLPAVVPNAGGIQEIVEDGATGYIYPVLDHEALAERMVRLAADPEGRAAMGQAARRAVAERFDVAEYVTRLYRMYGLDGYAR